LEKKRKETCEASAGKLEVRKKMGSYSRKNDQKEENVKI
jgi:hypothetical protein